MALEHTASPSTMGGSYSARRQLGIVEDCRQRLCSIGDALDHLERFPPESVDPKSWGDSIISLAAARVRVMLDLDEATQDFPSPNGRAVMVLLAEVKRLEGTLTNLVAKHNLRLPVDDF